MTSERNPHEWSSEALFSKAQRYAITMLEQDHNNWKFGFWSVLTLELLIRSALAKLSPVLLADGKDWPNILYAIGCTPNLSKFNPRSANITDLIKRMETIYPEFTKDMVNFSSAHLNKRNSELHSGTLAFDGIGTSSWLPMYYSVINVLLGIIDENLENLLGKDEAKNAIAQIEALKDENANSVNKSINAHRVIWGEKANDEKTKLSRQAEVLSSRHLGHRVTCPSCGNVALVDGSAVSPARTNIEDGYVIERQTMLPNKFHCVACQLMINGYSKLVACGLGDTYTSERQYEAIDYFDIDIEEQIRNMYEEDNNEP